MRLATTVDGILIVLAAAAATIAFMLLGHLDPLADTAVTVQHFAAELLSILFLAAWCPAKTPLAAMFAVAFAIMVANIHLELVFFMDMDPSQRLFSAATATLHCAVVVLIARLAGGAAESAPMIAQWPARGAAGWVTRIALAAATYVVLYFVVGAAAYAYTKPFYEEAAGLGLHVPHVTTVLTAQAVRGTVYALAALLYALTTPRSPRATLVAMGLFAGLGGIAPLAGTADWPLDMRLVHTIEIVLQNATFAAVALTLFKTRALESHSEK